MATVPQTTRREFLKRSAAIGAGAALVSPAAVRPAFGLMGDSGGAGYTVGCYTRPWDKYDYRVAFDAIAEAGFRHCGLMSTKPLSGSKSRWRFVLSAETTLEEAQRVGEEVRKRGMQIPSVYPGQISVHKSLEAGIDDLRKIVDTCAAARAKSVLLGGTNNEKLYRTYYKAVAECCDYAAEKGLTFTVKPHGGLTATGALCRKAVELVGHKNFGVWYDAGNVFSYSAGKVDPLKDVVSVDGLVMGMCIKDFQMEAEDPESKTVWVTPGTGKVDFPALLKRMRKGGFRKGALVVETFSRGDSFTQADLPKLLAEAKKAYTFVRDLAARIA